MLEIIGIVKLKVLLIVFSLKHKLPITLCFIKKFQFGYIQIATSLYSDRWILFHNFILCFWEILRSINASQVIIHMMHWAEFLGKRFNYPGGGNPSKDSCSTDLAGKEWETSWALPDPLYSEEWLLEHHAGLPWFQNKCESKN